MKRGPTPVYRTARKYVTDADRDRVFERDGAKCRVCGCKERHFLAIDHILPRKHGGTSALGNLQVLCFSCNREKGHKLTAAALRMLHPELRAEDLEYIGHVWAASPAMAAAAAVPKLGNTTQPVKIKDTVRPVLVPDEYRSAVLALLADLRNNPEPKSEHPGGTVQKFTPRKTA